MTGQGPTIRDLVDPSFHGPRWYRREQIPNQDGVRLVVMLHSGTTVVTQVIKNANGFHHLRDVPIAQVCGWRKAEAEDQDLGVLHNTFLVLQETPDDSG